ncbi:hypothetical protein [Bacillus phage SPbetaL1]|uniref:hypothetical protein n=1 Tax=Bacillus halotolerans TaxID=260554 RepID=UPI0007502557|nr:hypothetical protein [Bacillus halotolerans]KUP30293.1 hypothetical protein AU385_17930 [Bacillus halotolerans]PHI49700.1 hypothetical protein B9T64_06885 [Bacillus halotolerans]WIT26911.1 hypothetical protein [Bacillus phage SPbetaL1]
MREEIKVLKEEIGELEIALGESNNRTVSLVLQEAIENRLSEIEKLKPNGYVLANVALKDGTELKKCLVFTVEDQMGSEAVSDIEDAENLFKNEEEIYLQQEYVDGNFSGDIVVSEIATYQLSYENEAS